MPLKKLLWRKYLFVDRTEAETEQSYWNEKRKKHLAHEHTAGVVSGLEVTATSPATLSVNVVPGRALDADGNDPEVEAGQVLDLSSLVPPSGSSLVYITLTFSETDVEPYFVDEIGAYQDKYTLDGAQLEATTVPPVAPAVELARVTLTAGATEVNDAGDPESPADNEIDQTYRSYSGKEVINLEDLADVSADQAEAFQAMGTPSASNPIATASDIADGIAPIEAELAAAAGSQPSVDARLDVALNEDGSLKNHGSSHTGAGSDSIPAATPSVSGLMSAADKSKLNGIENGAVAAGEAGDLHAAVTTGNPHNLDSADVGATPASHIGTGGAAHAAATGSVAGFMSAADKTALDAHIGAGGAAHALALPGGAAGFLSGSDKAKLDTIAGAGTWKVLYPGSGNLEAQMSGMLPGDKYWLTPGTYVLGATLNINQNGVMLAGSREAIVAPVADAEVQLTGTGCSLLGFTLSNATTSTSGRCMFVDGAHALLEDLWVDGHDTVAGRRVALKINAEYCTVRRCRFLVGYTTPSHNQFLIHVFSRCTIEDNYFETIAAGDWPGASASLIGSSDVFQQGCMLRGNRFNLAVPAALNVRAITHMGTGYTFTGWAIDNHIEVSTPGNNVTGIALGPGMVADRNRIVGCGAYGIWSYTSDECLHITNNKVFGASGDPAAAGIYVWLSSDMPAKIEGNHVRYCEKGIVAELTGSGVTPRAVNILGNTVQDSTVEAVRIAGFSPSFVEHSNVSGNIIRDFAAGITVTDCRRVTLSHNQLVGGTGVGIDVGGGTGNYDVKVVACDVETAGLYCFRVGHQRNMLFNCSGRGASVAIYYVFGSHNHVVSCETHTIAGSVDILCIEGNRHSISGCDFAYGAGGYGINLMSTSSYCFVHDNRLASADGYNGGTANTIIDNVVGDTYKGTGF